MTAAEAQLNIAEVQSSASHELQADAPGLVTAIGAEPGEVVQAGRMIVQVARKDGRDAVFDVPARIIALGAVRPEIEVALTSDPNVTAIGPRPRGRAAGRPDRPRTFGSGSGSPTRRPPCGSARP